MHVSGWLKVSADSLPPFNGPSAGVDIFESKKPFVQTRIEPRFLGFPAPSLVTTLTELSLLPLTPIQYFVLFC